MAALLSERPAFNHIREAPKGFFHISCISNAFSYNNLHSNSVALGASLPYHSLCTSSVHPPKDVHALKARM